MWDLEWLEGGKGDFLGGRSSRSKGMGLGSLYIKYLKHIRDTFSRVWKPYRRIYTSMAVCT